MRKTCVSLVADVILAAFLLSACALASPPTASSTVLTAGNGAESPIATAAIASATPHPLSGSAEWDLVLIGDATLLHVGKPYANLIEQDRRVKVNLHDNWQGGLSAVTILHALRGDSSGSLQREKWPQLVRDAEVLVLFGNPIDSLSPQMISVAQKCLAAVNPGQVAISRDTFAQYKADLGAIHDEVARLHAGRPIIVRAVGMYNPFPGKWRDNGSDRVCEAFLAGLNAAAAQAAESHGVRFVSTWDAFNGPSHDEDPVARGLIQSDGEQPTEAGAQFYAKVLQESGSDTWLAREP